MQLCVKGGKKDAHALNMVELKIDDSYYIYKSIYIVDTSSSDVKVKELYMDKATLEAVTAKYNIDLSFNFQVKIFDNKRYVTIIILL